MRLPAVFHSVDRVVHTATVAGRACLLVPVALGVCAMFASHARAETSATITPLLSPERLGARTVLSLTIQFAGPSSGVPTPVRRSILRFPAGLTLEVPHLSSCSPSRVRAHGAGACPADSALGRGHALIEADVGSQPMDENVSLSVFLGPLHNLQPAIEVIGQGYTPLDERALLGGTLLPAGGPYGEALTLLIPSIPTLPLGPDASIVTFSLEIGARAPHEVRTANALRLPAGCPAGGFPFAAEFVYADGSVGSSSTVVPCPR